MPSCRAIANMLTFRCKECNIRERFFEFRNFEQKNGEFVFREIMRIIEKHFNIEICHGQAYDGAVNMSSQNVGVQKQLKDFCKNLLTPIVTVTI